jgi:hypothetical protein
MAYRFLADLLVAVHLAFVLFVVLGGVLVFRRRRLAFLHVPVALWGVFVEFSGRVCPLTPLEVRLRILGGQAGYSGGFVDQYLMPVLYPPGLTREQGIWLGILVGALNLGIYGFVVWRLVRDRREASQKI